ncbi:hypothetical protein AYI68_g1856 [Smittium mucronatum]|uniref:Uncharacterized protein n=1 Tax=Smittium mucronatum TaxID=133383 RepID=A0A1R0H4E7_9FUNG|nr:hypothetical protein AYI68_g1856 [Smittium mucronatum]
MKMIKNGYLHQLQGSSQGFTLSKNPECGANLEGRKMFNRSYVSLCATKSFSASENNNPGIKKLKFDYLGKKELELDGIEDQWCFQEV